MRLNAGAEAPHAPRGAASAPREGAAPRGAGAGAGWRGSLELAFERRDHRTILARRRHEGPLGVQRPFYPESDGTCHAYVLHPPGGLVAGDELALHVRVGAGGRALLTTPAATKLYRSAAGRDAQQCMRFTVEEGARLEWLPQETIAYQGARVRLLTRVDLEPGAAFLGCEVLCLGRPAIGEGFALGHLTQRLEIYAGRRPLLIERARYDGAGTALDAAYGLSGHKVVGSLVCVGPPREEAVRDAVRAALAQAAPGETAASELASALVCRYRGGSVERALRAFRSAWAVLRHTCFASPAIEPRIWAT
jgi:urease accessory protein